jgi:hypothetical protein
MTEADLPVAEPFREALAVHEAFRRLHIPAADIFVDLDPRRMVVEAKQNGQSFAFAVGPSSLSPADMLIAWQEAVRWWNDGGLAREPDRERLRDNSAVFLNAALFVAALIKHGFQLPHHQDYSA